jgi:hypothetical protein
MVQPISSPRLRRRYEWCTSPLQCCLERTALSGCVAFSQFTGQHGGFIPSIHHILVTNQGKGLGTVTQNCYAGNPPRLSVKRGRVQRPEPRAAEDAGGARASNGIPPSMT